MLSVYEGATQAAACGAAAVACNDDGCGVNGHRSSVRVLVQGHVQLLIRVASYGTSGPTGTFPLRVEEDAVPVGDVNTDGCVDVIDLLYLIAAFGSYSGDANYNHDCDFNSDGAVDVIDLLYMVQTFGTCV